MRAQGFVRPENRLPYALSLLCLALPVSSWAEDTVLDTVSVISTGNRSNTLTVADSPSPIRIQGYAIGRLRLAVQWHLGEDALLERARRLADRVNVLDTKRPQIAINQHPIRAAI